MRENLCFAKSPTSVTLQNNIRKKKLTNIEYKGKIYNGYDDLKDNTGISYHLYNKFYKNGIDPEQFIGNNTYAMTERLKHNPPRASKGKTWYNNGFEERYYYECPEGWKKGRLNARSKPYANTRAIV